MKSPEDILKETEELTKAKQDLIIDYGEIEYEYFNALEEIQETMYQMNLFDVNSALLKHQDPLMDNKSDLTP